MLFQSTRPFLSHQGVNGSGSTAATLCSSGDFSQDPSLPTAHEMGPQHGMSDNFLVEGAGAVAQPSQASALEQHFHGVVAPVSLSGTQAPQSNGLYHQHQHQEQQHCCQQRVHPAVTAAAVPTASSADSHQQYCGDWRQPGQYADAACQGHGLRAMLTPASQVYQSGQAANSLVSSAQSLPATTAGAAAVASGTATLAQATFIPNMQPQLPAGHYLASHVHQAVTASQPDQNRQVASATSAETRCLAPTYSPTSCWQAPYLNAPHRPGQMPLVQQQVSTRPEMIRIECLVDTSSIIQVYGYSDGSLISQETMQDATASHLAKQIFPPHVTDVLRQWMRFHIMWPYADPEHKQRLAAMTGLKDHQVNSWLTNARRRLMPKVIEMENQHRSKRGLPLLPEPKLKEKYPLGRPPSE